MEALTIEEEVNVKKKQKKKKKVLTNEDSVATRTRQKFVVFDKTNQRSKPKVGVVYDNIMTLHMAHREFHPERPERIMAIYLNLIEKGIYDKLVKLDSEVATEEELLMAHPKEHIEVVMNASKDPETKELLKPKQTLMGDTYRNMFTTQAALVAAGSTIEAVRAVCRDEVDHAFAIIRPPGHHAHCEKVGGFCFVNNAGVAARVA